MEGSFTAAEVAQRVYGSKVVVVSEQAMLNVGYAIKACMLVMYTRLTLGLAAHRAVRWLAWYVLAGWAASEVAFFAACRPFEGYWALPVPDRQCATLERYSLVQGTFNISSDVAMLFVPLPLVARMRMPWRQKAVLLVVFSLGAFVVVAALLTKIFNLTNVWDPVYMLWYVREASVAVYVSNLPMIWPLLRETFPILRALGPAGAVSSGTPRRTAAGAVSYFGGVVAAAAAGERNKASANGKTRPLALSTTASAVLGDKVNSALSSSWPPTLQTLALVSPGIRTTVTPLATLRHSTSFVKDHLHQYQAHHDERLPDDEYDNSKWDDSDLELGLGYGLGGAGPPSVESPPKTQLTWDSSGKTMRQHSREGDSSSTEEIMGSQIPRQSHHDRLIGGDDLAPLPLRPSRGIAVELMVTSEHRSPWNGQSRGRCNSSSKRTRLTAADIDDGSRRPM